MIFLGNVFSKLRKVVKERQKNPFMTPKKLRSAELKRRERAAARLRTTANRQHKASIPLRKKFDRTILLIEGCVNKRKKLTVPQQFALQKNLWALDKRLIDFIKTETKVMMEKELYNPSKARTENVFKMMDKLKEKTQMLENLGLVRKGFVTNTFYIKKPIKK